MFFIGVLLLMEPMGKSEKSEPQMGFEPTTLRDLFECSVTIELLETQCRDYGKGELWVSNFPERSISNSFHIYHSRICSFSIIIISSILFYNSMHTGY